MTSFLTVELPAVAALYHRRVLPGDAAADLDTDDPAEHGRSERRVSLAEL